MLKIHDNIPHIKGVIATRRSTQVKHKCTGKLEVFITAGGGRWRCSRLSPISPRAPISLWHLFKSLSEPCPWAFAQQAVRPQWVNPSFWFYLLTSMKRLLWTWHEPTAGLGSTPELELELELKPPELELELIFKRLAGVGVGVETPGVGVGVGVDILEIGRSWNFRSWSWNWSWNSWELELELELKLLGVGVGIGVEILSSFFYIYIYSSIIRNFIWTLKLYPSYYAY